MGLGGHLNTKGLYTVEEKRNLQRVAICCSAVGTVAALISLWWFVRLQRNFRRHLISLLIVGDLLKSLCYLVFASSGLALDGIQSTSAFCQVDGFLLQAGVGACDLAILFMSLHMSLQIFNSQSDIFGRDGLYRFRHTVTAVWALIPLVSASLAFIHGREGYVSQGPFCTLPIRPYWYRLALNWIPRYLIWAYVFFVAGRIYLHVGAQGFNVFHRKSVTLSQDVEMQPNSISSMSTYQSKTLEPIDEIRIQRTTSSLSPLEQRRREIRRQMRMLFIYPAMYVIMWAIPFVYHSMNYSDHYAQHPIYGLALVSVLCQTSMCLVDCIIFSWREKPWRHIGDGTFLGSFSFWTSPPEESPEVDTPATRPSSMCISPTSAKFSIRPPMHKKTYSNTSMEASRAAERLALERNDRRISMRLPTAEDVAAAAAPTARTNNRHSMYGALDKQSEWWDRSLDMAMLDKKDSNETE